MSETNKYSIAEIRYTDASIPSSDGGHDLAILVGGVRRDVSRHLKVGQDVLGDLERLGEGLVQDGGSDVPVTEHGRLGERQLAGEHPPRDGHLLPLLHPVALAVLAQVYK